MSAAKHTIGFVVLLRVDAAKSARCRIKPPTQRAKNRAQRGVKAGPRWSSRQMSAVRAGRGMIVNIAAVRGRHVHAATALSVRPRPTDRDVEAGCVGRYRRQVSASGWLREMGATR
jgi:hypothetical protein